MIVKDITGKSYDIDGCLACGIAKGELVPFQGLLYKDEYFHIEHDFEIPINGFIIISCMEHYTKLTDLPVEARHRLMDLTDKVMKLLRKANIADQFTILMEERPNYHLHLWILPRHDWIVERFGKINKNIKAIEDYAVTNLKTEENLKKITETCDMLKIELNKDKEL